MTRPYNPLAAALALAIAAFAAASQAAQELTSPDTCVACAVLPARKPEPRKA